MNKVKLSNKYSNLTDRQEKERTTAIFWGLSRGVHRNSIPKDRVEKKIAFLISNNKCNSPEIETRLIKLRDLNRKRNNG